MSIEVIDIIFIVIMLILGVRGLVLGFFSQIIMVIGFISAVLIAYFFSDNLAPYVANIVGENSWNVTISFLLLFLLVLLFSWITTKKFKRKMEKERIEGLDRLLGFSFGIIQGLVVSIGITLLITIQSFFDPTPMYENSIIGSKIVSIIPEIKKIIPKTQELIDEFDIEIPSKEDLIESITNKFKDNDVESILKKYKNKDDLKEKANDLKDEALDAIDKQISYVKKNIKHYIKELGYSQKDVDKLLKDLKDEKEDIEKYFNNLLKD